MNFGSERESKSFEDHYLGKYAYQPMGGNLIDSLLMSNDISHGVPDYGKWLHDSMSKMTPQDMYVMKTHGLTIEDIMRLKALQQGNYPIDPSAYPYKDGTLPTR